MQCPQTKSSEASVSFLFPFQVILNHLTAQTKKNHSFLAGHLRHDAAPSNNRQQGKRKRSPDSDFEYEQDMADEHDSHFEIEEEAKDEARCHE
jgi:hypothetical protein